MRAACSRQDEGVSGHMTGLQYSKLLFLHVAGQGEGGREGVSDSRVGLPMQSNKGRIRQTKSISRHRQ